MKSWKLTRRQQWMVLATVALFVAVLAVAVAIVVDGLIDNPGPSDVAVVLGNKVEDNGRPSRSLEARLLHVLELYRAGLCPAILVSGGVGSNGFAEGDVMRAFLVDRGVPADRVIVDNLGIDTYSTARNAAALMRERNWQTAILVSQFYHLPRTKYAFRRFGVSKLHWSHARIFLWRDFYAIGREVAANVQYRLRSYAE